MYEEQKAILAMWVSAAEAKAKAEANDTLGSAKEPMSLFPNEGGGAVNLGGGWWSYFDEYGKPEKRSKAVYCYVQFFLETKEFYAFCFAQSEERVREFLSRTGAKDIRILRCRTKKELAGLSG